jgi:prefoldin subunit 5
MSESELLNKAADEIERLTVNLGGSVAALKMCNDEIERMQAEIDQLSEQLAEATTEVEKLRELWENSPSAAR